MTGAGAGTGPDRIDAQLAGELRHRGEVGGRERRAGGGHGLVPGGREQLESARGGFEETARPGRGNTPRRSVDLRFGSTAWSVDRATRGPEVELVPAPQRPPSPARRRNTLAKRPGEVRRQQPVSNLNIPVIT